jgi:hypothetical protein
MSQTTWLRRVLSPLISANTIGSGKTRRKRRTSELLSATKNKCISDAVLYATLHSMYITDPA